MSDESLEGRRGDSCIGGRIRGLCWFVPSNKNDLRNSTWTKMSSGRYKTSDVVPGSLMSYDFTLWHNRLRVPTYKQLEDVVRTNWEEIERDNS